MYKIRPSAKFQKDLKRIQKRGYDITLLKDVLNFWLNYTLWAFQQKKNVSQDYKSIF